MSYIKRSVFTFAFKGRPRRGLFWKKNVYRLWFEYAKVSPLSVPKEFGELSLFDDFEDWWRHPNYGFELFCEPAKKTPLSVVTEINNEDNNDVIYLSVDLTAEPQKLKRMFSSFLKRHQPKVKPLKSLGKFQPSLHGKYIRLDALKMYLETWKMRESGMTRNDIHTERYGNKTKKSMKEFKFNIIESDLRVISRQTQRANEIFNNIENGTFP